MELKQLHFAIDWATEITNKALVASECSLFAPTTVFLPCRSARAMAVPALPNAVSGDGLVLLLSVVLVLSGVRDVASYPSQSNASFSVPLAQVQWWLWPLPLKAPRHLTFVLLVLSGLRGVVSSHVDISSDLRVAHA